MSARKELERLRSQTTWRDYWATVATKELAAERDDLAGQVARLEALVAEYEAEHGSRQFERVSMPGCDCDRCVEARAILTEGESC